MAITNQNQLSNLMTDPVRNFKFLVQFSPISPDGKTQDAYWNKSASQSSTANSFGTMGFVSLTGLSVSTESIAYREGGYNTNVHQIPGQSSFTPITLTKGVMLGQMGNADWMRRLFTVLTPQSGPTVGEQFRCNLDIQVLTHPNPGFTAGSDSTAMGDGATSSPHTSLRFKVYNAWITSLTYSNLDAGANTLMVEDITLVHEGFDVSYATDYTKGGTAPGLGGYNA